MPDELKTTASVTHVCDHGSSSEWCPKCFPDAKQTTQREPGFYRVMWKGRLAIGFLHTLEEPRAWDPHPSQHWSILFADAHLYGESGAYTSARDLPDDRIGERIEWTK